MRKPYPAGIGPRPCTDHKGNCYGSRTEMIAAYGITPQTFYRRLQAGMSEQDALETPARGCLKPTPCKDHLGNEYPSKTAMAKAYEMTLAAMNSRLRTGKPLEEALGTPVRHHAAKAVTNRRRKEDNPKPHHAPGPKIPAAEGSHGGYRPTCPCRDHTGAGFPSVSAMCRHWRVSQATYRARIKTGWSVKDALTVQPKTDPSSVRCMDHKGNVFPSIRAMCAEYGVDPANLRQQIKDGRLLADILEPPKKDPPAFDHKGRRFESELDMIRHYHVEPSLYSSRIERCDRLEEILEGYYTDWCGNRYKSIREMADILGVNNGTLYKRTGSSNLPSGVAAAFVCAKFWPGQTVEGYDIKSCSGFPWFECVRPDGKPDTMHANEILALKRAAFQRDEE